MKENFPLTKNITLTRLLITFLFIDIYLIRLKCTVFKEVPKFYLEMFLDISAYLQLDQDHVSP